MHQLKQLLLKSVLLSTLIHLLIFKIFIIEFNIKPEPFKPRIHFLGSFLQLEDMIQLKGKAQTPSINLIRETRDEIIKDIYVPVQQLQYIKPKHVIPEPIDKKRSLKSTFDIDLHSESTSELKNMLENQFLFPSYQPLKYNRSNQ